MKCTANIDKLSMIIDEAKLDALIAVVGDDQNEQYFDDNMPSVLISRGDTIVSNNPLQMPDDAP